MTLSQLSSMSLVTFLALYSSGVSAEMRPCSPDDGPSIQVRELPKKDQHIGHPLEVVIQGKSGLSEVSLLESLRKRSFVEVIDGRDTFRMYLNYRLDPSSADFIVVQASNKKGATRCRAFRVTTTAAN